MEYMEIIDDYLKKIKKEYSYIKNINDIAKQARKNIKRHFHSCYLELNENGIRENIVSDYLLETTKDLSFEKLMDKLSYADGQELLNTIRASLETLCSYDVKSISNELKCYG